MTDKTTQAFKDAANCGRAEVPLTEPQEQERQTPLEQLRTRGTPLELIQSYLAADQHADAVGALQTSVLEYIEHVLLQTGVDLHEGDITLHLVTTDALHHKDEHVYLDKACEQQLQVLDSGEHRFTLTASFDTGQVVQTLAEHILNPIQDRLAAHVKGTVHSVPALCHTRLERRADTLITQLTLPTFVEIT